MYKSFLIGVALVLTAGSASATCRSVYDWKSGNYYQVCDNYGQTTTRGYNYNTGSNWSQTNNSNGSYYGTDKNGNYYSGNNRTGFYSNLGTGRTCFGTGAFRTCN